MKISFLQTFRVFNTWKVCVIQFAGKKQQL